MATTMDNGNKGCNARGGCFLPGSNNNKKRKQQSRVGDDDSSPYEGTDADLAKQMNELSVQEREKVLEEIHGVADAAEESPEFLQSCIQALDAAIAKIPKAKRKALDKAFFLRPQYQQNDNNHHNKFKLMFLRADYYDPQKAAKRMAKFFDWKLKIFGEAGFVKDIALEDDLGEDDVIETAVLSGCSLQLPHRDQTGRPITMFDISKFDHDGHPKMLKYTWYLFMAIVQDDEAAQIKGITNVTYAPQARMKALQLPKMSAASEHLRTAGDMMASLPVRITSYHFCTDDPGMKFLLGIIRMGIGKEMSLRLRTHFGSAIEMQYSLLTFGIHCGDLLTSAGNGKTKLHDQYVATRRRVDTSRQEQVVAEEEGSGIVLYPRDKDVLIGRGRPYHEFEGTRNLIRLIDTQLERYYQTDDRFWKTCINMEIVKQIEERGGRFLQRTSASGGWKILDDIVAREKTANLFRYRYNTLGKVASTAANAGNSLSRTPSPLVVADASCSSSSATGLLSGVKRVW
eukprot:CAMPEP_0117052190 /NCGR_PEP_ID=MMETSP0472-20121206/36081_1 /TAXON_ID=693140 ORGANISM="Tiarina fusus, Strain LIS" /NCGR_SAMPLE_ID=MMETSP0472 /ASSEMBLY_ACC=CAM_ASM_000603 /LENGTH=513 /DNA_ID=CAMNT_0004766733 /DNA_START=115 /DNA_END=1653 /DNA_ORIENTATION=+